MDCVERELENDRFLLGANELDLEREYFPLSFLRWLSSRFDEDGELQPDECRVDLLPLLSFLLRTRWHVP